MHRFPDFDKDVRRPFTVAEGCCDCMEFYHGCPSRLENQLGRCLDFHPLPGVKPGTTGQMVPESKMDGRTVHRVRRELTPDDQGPALASVPAPARKPRKLTAPTRTPSPAANHGSDGERLCACEALLRKRRSLSA